MLSSLFCLLVAAAPADEPVSRPPAREAIIEQFLTTRPTEPLTEAARTAAIAAVREAASHPATRQDAITSGLKLLSPEFNTALQQMGADDSQSAVDALTPLTTSTDRFLAAEAQLFLARALMNAGRYEESLPVLDRLIKDHSSDTIRLGEAWFLKGKLEAGSLQREAAEKSLRKFLDDFPEEPGRMQGEARATLLDLEEADADLLTDIHSKMNYSGRRLTLADSGQRTQEVQEDVVSLLTEMIEELEKKSSSCKGCQSASAKSGGGMGGANPGLSAGSSQASTAVERNAPRTPWVDLSERQNDPSAFNAAKSRVPVQYRGLVEQYYQSFGEKREK